MKTVRNFAQVLFLSLTLVTLSFSAKAEGEDSFVKVENQDLTAWKNADQRTAGNAPTLLPGQKLEVSNGKTEVTSSILVSSQETISLPADVSAVNSSSVSR